MNTTPHTPRFTAKRLFPVAAIALAAALAGCFDSGKGGGGDKEEPVTRQWLIDSGAVLFQSCTGCHYPGGKGHPGVTPPLANADFIMANPDHVIEVLLRGGGEWQDDSIVVNGMVFQTGEMIAFDYWTDFQIAATLTYIRAVLNDSTVVSCEAPTEDPETGDPVANCVKEPRPQAEIDADSVAVGTVTAIRDSLIAAGLLD